MLMRKMMITAAAALPPPLLILKMRISMRISIYDAEVLTNINYASAQDAL